MNKKYRLAVLLLVVAMILSIISIIFTISIESIDNESEKNPVGETETSPVQGTIQLIVNKRDGGETNEGG